MIDVHLITNTIFWQNPAWLASATGILALLLSFWNLKTQKDIAKLTARSKIKEKWLHDFKDHITDFIYYRKHMNDLLQDGTKQEKYIEALQNAAQIKQKIKWFLDCNNKHHKIVLDNLNEWEDICDEWKTKSKSGMKKEERIEILERGAVAANDLLKNAKILTDEEIKKL
ncbi:MAG: hypothetical protein JWP32_2989 [Schumannella sp.]|nr:hypothetical protein [Schumannella sp.]